MAVFKNDVGSYEIDFSEEVAEKLKKLWKTNKEKYEDLEEYMYEKFDWLSGLNVDVLTLFEGFKSEEKAKKCDFALHKEIYKWFRENMN